MSVKNHKFEVVNEVKIDVEKKLIQKQFNTNVAFYLHLKEYNATIRKELIKKIEEVFFFAKGVDWKFDSFGIEKASPRHKNILGYFVFRATSAKKLQDFFIQEFKDYENIIKISCSIAKYEKVEEMFFEINGLS